MTGTELKSWMHEHRYSIHRLAGALAIHPSTVQRYRTGELKVPRVVCLALDSLARNT